jgi:transcriptional regulator GlxA family with amidase domain
VEGLARGLLAADQIGGSLGQIYAEYIGIAIVARIFTFERESGLRERRKVAELPHWRLKRAVEYIESHLAEPVTLADMASAAGVTRMHFAAQFRTATGLRPHEYLLRRRIDRAQEELVGTGMSLVDVALSVGFPTQSHFGSVFKRFVGRPPSAWRRLHSDEKTQPLVGEKRLGQTA